MAAAAAASAPPSRGDELVELTPTQLASVRAAVAATHPEGEPPTLATAEEAGPKLVNSLGFTKEEWAEIVDMRARVADVRASPHWRTAQVYHRFLVARKHDADKAEAMYRAAMSWRESSGADRLLWEYSEPKLMAEYFASGLVGVDRSGYPVLVERIGALDLAGLGAAMGPSAFLKWVAWYHERQERAMAAASAAASEQLGRPVSRHKMTVIVDLKGITMGHLSSATMSVLKRRTALEEANYPEVVRRVFIVRAPTIFAGVWSLVKTFVDAGTRAKMSLMATGFLPSVEAIVPAERIPAFVGGEYRDGEDDECAATIGTGGAVPHAFLVGPDGEAATHSVAAGATLRLSFAVPAGAALRVRWACAAGDTFRAGVVGSVAGTVSTACGAVGSEAVEGPAADVAPEGTVPLSAELVPATAAVTAVPSSVTAGATGLITVEPVVAAAGDAATAEGAAITLAWTSTAWVSSQQLEVRAEARPVGSITSKTEAGEAGEAGDAAASS